MSFRRAVLILGRLQQTCSHSVCEIPSAGTTSPLVALVHAVLMKAEYIFACEKILTSYPSIECSCRKTLQAKNVFLSSVRPQYGTSEMTYFLSLKIVLGSNFVFLTEKSRCLLLSGFLHFCSLLSCQNMRKENNDAVQ